MHTYVVRPQWIKSWIISPYQGLYLIRNLVYSELRQWDESIYTWKVLTRRGWVTYMCVIKLGHQWLDDGLSPVISTNADLLLFEPLIHWNLNQNTTIFLPENEFENAVRNSLSLPQCVNSYALPRLREVLNVRYILTLEHISFIIRIMFTHWDRNEITAIWQSTFSKSFF